MTPLEQALRERHLQVESRLHRAAVLVDRHTRPGREAAARLITQANAIKRGAEIPDYARTEGENG